MTAFLHHDGIDAAPAPPAAGWRRLLARDADEVAAGPWAAEPGRRGAEEAESAYVSGFNAALSRDPGALPALLDGLPRERWTFACEGAGAASAVLDLLTLSRGRRLRELLSGPAAHHHHAVHLGAGRGYALLRLPPMRGACRGHPLLRWLAVDGYGYQRGLEAGVRLLHERAMPGLLTRARCATFDQGLGRLLWHHERASAESVADRVAGFPAGRRGDLWAGVAYAATRTGGATGEELALLAERAGADGYRSGLAQGCAFASMAVVREGALLGPAVLAAPILADAEPEEAASWADRALLALGHDARTHDDYLAWQWETRRAWAHRHPRV
ncbi:DUF1702 family protein [Nonomuraea roseoviolacea]|uniref:DUF1702 family protein n=1 Tax=Nonomuraea roseoviolacea subsp. carminata TaxID=160689 RepID=A0ABT1K3Y0_9ACTN|nr:DUF1702 family protein [Nonomuraea roseoviolacea]MCP2348705.1 hypothetical protein [Nonomuraea roseoviolacea subsp. carminata]